MKTVEMHQFEGTYREDRHGKKAEVKPISQIPEPPSHLTKEEAKIFREIAAKMFENELISTLDTYTLENYCIQLALCRKAKKELEETGEYVTVHINKNGSANSVPSPWLMILKSSSDIMLKLGGKLGLNPVDRGRATKTARQNEQVKSLLR